MRTVRRFHIQETGILYPSENGMVCYYMDVERLEAQCAKLESECAELLEALEWLITIQSIVSISEAMHRPAYQKAVEQARAAIAKAKGESNE